jgi:hypothetical protein
MWRRPAFIGASIAMLVALVIAIPVLLVTHGAKASAPTYDITTLAGKVASVNGTAGLNIRMSAFIQQEADSSDTYVPGTDSSVITPTYVLSSPLDGTAVAAPNVTVNQDTGGAPQNETSIAVDPNNASRVVGSANDYVTRTWTCTLPGGTPCSARGDGYSGTYYSNNGGATWCCASNLDGSSLGTLIPGVTHLAGGPYDAGGDPAVAFDSRGNVYYSGLGFDRAASPNTVAVNKGTFNGAGALTWGAPTFIDATTSPAIFNDKEWIGADAHAGSPFRDRVYVTFTRFIFDPITGAYVQSPIFAAYSTDGGKTFSSPESIVGNVLYDQGSRPLIGADGTVYVFFEGSTRLAAASSTYVVKSTDGGVTWGKPLAVATVADIATPKDAVFRVNSFPAADIAPNGKLYVAWSTQVHDSDGSLCFTGTSNGCHSKAVYSTSSDGGATWSAPTAIFPALDAANRTPIGYPAPAPGSSLTPDTHRVDTFWPGVAVSPSGRVYMSAYAADVVSPWQTCAKPATPTAVGRINCLTLGGYINNARLDYAVADLTTGVSQIVTTHPINTRGQFGGGFIGDYTDIAVGSDNVFHALWTDTNNKQTVVWFYGYQFVPTTINQQDIVTDAGNF